MDVDREVEGACQQVRPRVPGITKKVRERNIEEEQASYILGTVSLTGYGTGRMP